MKHIFFIILGIIVSSCGNNRNIPTKEKEKENIPVDDKYSKVYFENNSVIPGKYRTTEMLYVINPNGSKQFNKPDTNAAVVGEFNYGQHVWFIRTLDTTVNNQSGTWVELVEQVEKKIEVKGVDFTGKVFEIIYLKKSDLGTEDKLMITKDEIYEVYDNNYKPSLLSKKFVQIQSLSREEFYKAPPPNDWVRVNTNWTYEAVQKNIRLKLNKVDTLLSLNNKPFEAETDYHVYMGDLDQINCYLIFGGYYEAHRYLLYDKDYGDCKASLIGYPCISPNKKYVVSFYDNPYGDGGGDLEIHTITNQGPYKLVKSLSFTNWRPFEYPIEFAWLNDSEFKIKVYTFSKHFRPWTDNEIAPMTGYLKFKIQ